MTRAMALEMKEAGIRVNSISPDGVQRSQLDQRIMADSHEAEGVLTCLARRNVFRGGT